MSASEEKPDEGPKHHTVSLRLDWFWPCVAAMVIALMAFGYDCHGCGDCRSPADHAETQRLNEQLAQPACPDTAVIP